MWEFNYDSQCLIECTNAGKKIQPSIEAMGRMNQKKSNVFT